MNTLSTLEVRPSPINNQGCFTLIPLTKRRKIARYAGELLRGQRLIAARINEQTQAGDVKIIALGCGRVAIDAAVGGDQTAYINHSCEPNAYMREVPGEKVVFFALRDIAAGEEITIDYRDPEHPPVGGCRCGAARCRSRQPRQKALCIAHSPGAQPVRRASSPSVEEFKA